MVAGRLAGRGGHPGYGRGNTGRRRRRRRTLDVGETWTWTYTYAVTQDDLDSVTAMPEPNDVAAEFIDNTATVDSTELGAEKTATRRCRCRLGAGICHQTRRSSVSPIPDGGNNGSVLDAVGDIITYTGGGR